MRDFKFFKRNKKEFNLDDIFVPVRGESTAISGMNFAPYLPITRNVETLPVFNYIHCDSIFNFIKNIEDTDAFQLNRLYNTFTENGMFSFVIINKFNLVNPNTFDTEKCFVVIYQSDINIYTFKFKTDFYLNSIIEYNVTLSPSEDLRIWNRLNS
jgi:hypothetical protein